MLNATRHCRLVALALGVLLSSVVAGNAMAETKWEKAHPRRDQVNDRLQRQNLRIHREVREGDLTKAQAAQLRRDDQKIRREESLMASQNGGHITKSEQRVLNQQENVVSKAIGK